MGANTPRIEDALALARLGLRILPLKPREKTPLIRNWPTLATTDPTTIQKWFAQWPKMNIGVATGHGSDVIVIDVDSYRGGDEALEALVAELGPLPDTPESLTGGGGRQLFHRRPVGVEIHNASDKEGHAGFDVRGEGGYVVVPPSVHPNGKPYAWEIEHDPRDGYPFAELPRAWVEFLSSRGRAAERKPVKPNGTNPNGTLQEGSRNTTLTQLAGAMRRRGCDEVTIRAVLLAENAKRCNPPLSESEVAGIAASVARYEPAEPKAVMPRRPWAPFPTELLPEPVERFVVATADALGCDPAMVAMPTLSVLAASVGTTRVAVPKGSWAEPCIIWTCNTCRSGSLKTPGQEAAVKPLLNAQILAMQTYAAEMEAYETAMDWYDKRKKEFDRKASATEPPVKPERPTCRRVLVSDTTTEALAPILLANPRGLLVARDELAGWFRGFNQYKKQGSDVAQWLELHRAGTLIVDRKSGDMRTIFVPRAAVSLCGTIQPRTLAAVLTPEMFESGMAARILIAQPPERIKKWSKRVPSAATVAAYEAVIGSLLTLQHEDGEHGPQPIRLRLTEEAEFAWAEWYNRHGIRQFEADSDDESAALAKLEGYGLRFALLFTLADHPTAPGIGADAIRRGCRLADWFAGEAERVYGTLAESGEDRERRQLVEWIRRRGDAVTVRELTHGMRRFRGRGDAASEALNGLASDGLGAWRNDGARDGRPSESFHLNPVTDTDAADAVTGVTVSETPIGVAGNDGFGDGDGGDGVQSAIIGDDAETSIDELNGLADDASDADREAGDGEWTG
ncbi:MAG: DUF3987 domain-containing protein [Phycisphaerales bacterium]|nr:DUF3987 domain-containing protein [Phycisphaerales bacterium]